MLEAGESSGERIETLPETVAISEEPLKKKSFLSGLLSRSNVNTPVDEESQEPLSQEKEEAEEAEEEITFIMGVFPGMFTKPNLEKLRNDEDPEYDNILDQAKEQMARKSTGGGKKSKRRKSTRRKSTRRKSNRRKSTRRKSNRRKSKRRKSRTRRR